jgi:hypothetical protein
LQNQPGGDKTPTDSIAIKNREQLIFLLCEAATLEHMIMCEYLYASFALKRSVSEGLTPEQLEAVKKWEKTITDVAEQEMLHLSLANNLLSSIGAAPYFGRVNFPSRSRYFPSSVRLALLPLDETSLRYFLFLERPEAMAIEDVPGFYRAMHTEHGEQLVPESQMFATVGELYRGIEEGFRYLSKTYGEKQLFIGTAHDQATEEYFGWKELTPVTDLASAMAAIQTIITEGEGARGDWKEAHFGKFLRIFNEYQEFKAKDPAFTPSRPSLAAFVRVPGEVETSELIDDPFTARVSDLFNASYEVLLQVLSRFFLQVDTTKEGLRLLSSVSIRMMITVMKPLGTLLTTLPVGPHRPGLTAGPTFEMYRMGYLLPRSRAAWIILHERMQELTGYCSELAHSESAPKILLAVERSLGLLAKALEPFASTEDSGPKEKG